MRTKHNRSETAWESFDHPVDTWLPGMKFGGESKLISWRNLVDSAPGSFSAELNQSGGLQFVVRWNYSVQYWDSGIWDGKAFSNIPQIQYSIYNISMENTTTGVYFTYTVNGLYRLVMGTAAQIPMYKTIDCNKWFLIWSTPRDQCEVYGLCGAFGICNSNNIQFCSCPQEFESRDEKPWVSQEWWSGRCVRRSPLNCGAKNKWADKLISMNAWLHDKNDRFYAATLKDCEEACIGNCSCTALKYISNICQIWKGDLLNMRNAPPKDESVVFIRAAASEFGASSSYKGRRSKVALVVGVVVACAIVLAILAYLVRWIYWMSSNRSWANAFTLASCCKHPEASEVDTTTPIRMFTYKELQISTKSFKHKLGSGAFGSVFRGTLPDGTLVAVKKLQGTEHGEKQFRAEINTVGNVNHVNLMRLHGICAENSRRLLVYDYMPNGSLNTILFSDKSKLESKLDWRARFEIALRVARGLVIFTRNARNTSFTAMLSLKTFSWMVICAQILMRQNSKYL